MPLSLLDRLKRALSVADAIVRSRGGLPALALLLAFGLAARMPPGGPVAPAHGDVPDYLSAAYHLHHSGTYAMDPRPDPVAPGIGREPGYPLFLAGIMAIDPGFAMAGPSCLQANDACAKRLFEVPKFANLALIVAAGIVMFVVGRQVAGVPAALVACGYLTLNSHMNKAWADLMSDRLAVFLVSLAMLAVLLAWRKGGAARGVAAGAALAALALTKAIFVPFCVVAFALVGALAWRGRGGRRGRAAFLAAALSFGVTVGCWVARNWEVSGQARVTDARSGIALSTRAVFDEMSPRQYAASVVYFCLPSGARLAERWFGKDTAASFSFEQFGGYYDRGQNGYAVRVAEIRRSQPGLSRWQATAALDREITAEIAGHPLGYAASMVPILGRGLRVDEFLFVGLPCLLVALWRAWRGRDGLLGLLLGLGAFNIVAYAALSLNIPRYQMTAVPAIALAAGLVLTGGRGQGRGILLRAEARAPLMPTSGALVGPG